MTYNRKAIIAIADGLGDRPIKEFGELTPLQKARTPNLDKIAETGINGMMDLIAPGIPVGTDMGHLVLFGGEKEDYSGRGPIEAAGINMDIEKGDIIFRCNFATIDDNDIVLDRRAGRINEGTRELAEAINELDLGDGIIAYFQPATEHRAVLILRGDNLSEKISDSDPKIPRPGLKYKKIKALDNTLEAKRTAHYLNLFLEKSHDILKNHPINQKRINSGLLPANFILTRGPGIFKEPKSLIKKLNIKACCIAGETTVLGVAKLLGITPKTDSSFKANIDSNLSLKAKMTLEAIKEYDLVFVHIKATDLAGHDNLPKAKVLAIEAYDKMVGEILKNIPDNCLLGLAADHSTPCEFKEHTGEPVPISITGQSIRKDKVRFYDEISCAEGGLFRLSGNQFINTVIDLIGLSHKQGS